MARVAVGNFEPQLVAAANAGQVFTGWRGYFTGRAVHIRKTDLAPLMVR